MWDSPWGLDLAFPHCLRDASSTRVCDQRSGAWERLCLPLRESLAPRAAPEEKGVSRTPWERRQDSQAVH